MDNKLVLKKRAAEEAVGYVESGMVVGLGTGSTAGCAIELIAERIKGGVLRDVLCIPSSIRTENLAKSLGIPLTTLDDHPEIDITIDGADEVDPELNMIKGGGGALLREKVLQQQSRRTVIIVDESKLSPVLGSGFALPVEVVPFAMGAEVRHIESLGARVTVRKDGDGTLYKTDQGNVILDCAFSEITDAYGLASRLEGRAGVVEHGLFLGLADEVIVAVGGSEGSEEDERGGGAVRRLRPNRG